MTTTASIRAITASTQDHLNALQCMVGTLAKTDKSVPVLAYALDSYVAKRADLLQEANAKVTVRQVNWTLFPAHARVHPNLRQKQNESVRAGHYAWKPLLIAWSLQHTSERTLVWLDAERRGE